MLTEVMTIVLPVMVLLLAAAIILAIPLTLIWLWTRSKKSDYVEHPWRRHGFFHNVWQYSGWKEEAEARKSKIFNDLPELGKARVLKQSAKTYKGVLITAPLVVYGVAVLILSPFTALLPAYGAYRLARSHWKEADDASKAADARRAKAMGA